MVDGWFRIKFPNGKEVIEEVQTNITRIGTVKSLLQQGCTFEQVVVLSSDELKMHLALAIEVALVEFLEAVSEGEKT